MSQPYAPIFFMFSGHSRPYIYESPCQEYVLNVAEKLESDFLIFPDILEKSYFWDYNRQASNFI